MSGVRPLHRTLEQELVAVLRGVSLECLVCGEFLLHASGAIVCPECGAQLVDGEEAASGLPLSVQTG